MDGVDDKPPAPAPAPKPISGNVVKVRQKFGVLEDGVLAHSLQEEEYTDHYSGNINRRRTVRKDIKTAKELATEAALEAYTEEHEYVQRLKSIEEQDKETAKDLYREMLEEERKKAESVKAVNETDEEIAKRLQTEEMKKREREKMERESVRLARQLSQQDNAEGAVGGLAADKEPVVKVLTDEELAKRLQAAEIKKMREKHQRREAEADRLARQITESERHKSSNGTSRIPNGDSQRLMVDLPNGGVDCDSDEDTDCIAQSTKDEIFARKLQMQENQRRGQLTEEQLKLMKHDEKIARKMQHEEAMIAKKKVYKRYQEKVDNEVAYLEPMVHIGLERKISVPLELQQGNGIRLRDIKVTDGQQGDGSDASGRLSSPQSPVSPQQSSPGPPLPPSNANVFTSIDPTYKPAQSTNVRLIKQRSLSEDAPVEGEPTAEAPSRTKSKKEKSKKDKSKEKEKSKDKSNEKEKSKDKSNEKEKPKDKSKEKKDKHTEEPKDKSEEKPLKKKKSFFGKKK